MTVRDVETIGFIGAGNIGSNLARLAIQHGYEVVLSNSRGPDSLRDEIDDLGEHAHAVTTEEAARAGDVVVVTIPLKAIDSLPVAALAGKVVIDTCNYYPQRDGQIEALDAERTTTSQLVQDHLSESKVVKAFNHIFARDLVPDARPKGASDRRALVVAGNDSGSKELVAALIDDLGYDVVDIGDLSESWRIQRDTPGYTKNLNRDDLVTAIAAATREPT